MTHLTLFAAIDTPQDVLLLGVAICASIATFAVVFTVVGIAWENYTADRDAKRLSATLCARCGDAGHISAACAR